MQQHRPSFAGAGKVEHERAVAGQFVEDLVLAVRSLDLDTRSEQRI